LAPPVFFSSFYSLPLNPPAGLASARHERRIDTVYSRLFTQLAHRIACEAYRIRFIHHNLEHKKSNPKVAFFMLPPG